MTENKYNDPDRVEIEQYSLDYLRRLRASGQNAELVRLHEAGHFRLAIEEERQTKAENRKYSRQKGVQQAGSQKGLADKLEAEEAAKVTGKAAKKKQALDMLRRLGIDPEDLK
ncbi:MULTISPECIES: hypothetical protein [Streptomyces]|uniref:Uncharacterized protein n=1 Tax=Streptomyces venezuelae TaxID=54571 RepID=A0A5P2AZH3_STRVZ|nr:hypothetical protein [Streptomyces venezuelae]QES23643.1 hypothetical protein DEJ46_34710 [Streptomyces venezuelae]